jgi:outer membrane receptor protein involved in Fe transport
VNNGASGAATLDLRGLSEPRTLPLVDGRRVVGYGPNGIFDSAMVPVALVERIDVVTGGASAVYGSDAIAGVVNFILKDDFEGLDVRYNRAWNDLHDTGVQNDASVTLGANFDDGRGNVVLSMNWLDREEVYQIKGPAALTPGASSTTTPSAFDFEVGPRQQVTATGELVDFYQGFDFNGQNLYQQPQQRWGATALASYEINESVEAYGRFMFQSSTSAPQLASSGTFGFSFEVPVDNPFLTPDFRADLIANNPGNIAACSEPTLGDCATVGVRWRAVPVGARQYAYEYDTFQTLFGMRGDIGETGWTWDVAYAYGESSLKRRQNNDVDADRIQQAFFATSTTECFDTSNFCSPLNIFDPSQGINPEAIDFIRLGLQADSLTTQEYVTGSISGDLADVHSPFATTPIGLAFGAEWREETSDYQPDAASRAGVSPGFGQTLPVAGAYDVMEFFGEALVPLVENAAFADSINLELGYRVSDYSSSGSVESYKYGIDWSPVESLRFRAMFQQAVRAASINELFGPYTPGTGDLLVDPCADQVLVAGDLYDLCLATGVPGATLNAGTLDQPTSGQINNFSGGNPNLQPETADTITLGFVFRPTGALTGFTATVDYFDITVEDAISIRPAFDILDGCYNTGRNTAADPLASDCLLIARNVNGSLEGDLIYGVNQQTQNIGEVHIEGLDYSFGYAWDIGAWGNIDASFEGTHLLSTEYTPSGGFTVDCLGYYGKTCGLPSTLSASVGGPVSEDRWIQRTTWTLGDWDLSYRWRHLSAVSIDPLTEEFGTITGTLDPDSLSIPEYDYFDLSVGWQATDFLRLQANVTNVTNEEAPFVATETGSTGFNSGNSYPSTYDVLGRVFTVGATARF